MSSLPVPPTGPKPFTMANSIFCVCKLESVLLKGWSWGQQLSLTETCEKCNSQALLRPTESETLGRSPVIISATSPGDWMHAGACEARSLAVGSRRAELSSVQCTAGSPGPTLSSTEQVLCVHFTNEQMMHVGRQENGFGLFFPLFLAKSPGLATGLCHPLALLRGLNTDKGRNGERERL